MLWVAAVLVLGVISGLGPAEDRSHFVSAAVVADQNLGIFTFTRLIYRPPVGWRKFPDGGIGQYLTDRKIIGTVDLATGKVKILLRKDNERWAFDQGDFYIGAVCGTKVLVSEAGQRRSDLLPDVHRYGLDLSSGELNEIFLEQELARRGRGMGTVQLAKPDGTLVFVTSPKDYSGDVWRNPSIVPEIWVRYPSGDYQKAGEGMYRELKGGELFFTRGAEYQAFHLETRVTRPASRAEYAGSFATVPRDSRYCQDSDIDLRVESGKKNSLELGRRVNGSWRWEPLPLDLSALE